MPEPRNEFERRAAASQAAEENRPPSPSQRYWTAALGVLCLLQWTALVVLLARSGGELFSWPGVASAVANTGLLVIFANRLWRTGTVWRRSGGR